MVTCGKCGATVEIGKHPLEECRKSQWERICPPLYRENDVARFPNAYEQVKLWQFGDKGLVLVGKSGMGKTRMVYERLRPEFYAGRRIKIFDCVAFGHECAAKFAEGEGEMWIERLSRVEILFLDDLDKPKFTERVETELFGLIEKRIANRRPILATTQIGPGHLRAKFDSEARADGIIRRLREFCQIVQC